MDILLWKTILTPTPDMIGDTISVLAVPETTVGVLTVGASIGDTVLNVNSTVTDNGEALDGESWKEKYPNIKDLSDNSKEN